MRQGSVSGGSFGALLSFSSAGRTQNWGKKPKKISEKLELPEKSMSYRRGTEDPGRGAKDQFHKPNSGSRTRETRRNELERQGISRPFVKKLERKGREEAKRDLRESGLLASGRLHYSRGDKEGAGRARQDEKGSVA